MSVGGGQNNNLTSYYAKRIIGDSAAATPSHALVQMGTSIDTATWILHNTARTNQLYGIKYAYDTTNNAADKIEYYGKTSTDNATAWIALKTGDFYLLGKLGVGIDPTASYKLQVSGNSYFDGTSDFTGAVHVTATTSSSSKTTGALIVDGGIGAAGNIYADKVYNAVWNDYAEFRKGTTIIPGTCVQENDDGCLTPSNTRLIAGASIISDTYGNSMGETDEAKTPIAVSGRVLAYTYQPREKYHAGMAVCSAPNGTIDIMTREEIKDFPDAIIGIVSEIPNYDIWGSGNVEVNNRIWIKIK